MVTVAVFAVAWAATSYCQSGIRVTITVSSEAFAVAASGWTVMVVVLWPARKVA